MSNISEEKISTDTELDKKFDTEINLLGRVTSIIALLLMFSVPLIMMLRSGVSVSPTETMSVLGSLFALFAPMAVIENISYYAIIGAGGVYLCSITGNVMNMKIPSAISGMKLANVEPGSRKGDIISILSIATSSIVTVTILFFGMLVIGRFLTPILSNPVLAPGFANIMPSLLGALVVPFVLKNPRLSITPFALSIVLCLTLGVAVVQRYMSYFLPVVIIASVSAAYFMYKLGVFTKNSTRKEG